MFPELRFKKACPNSIKRIKAYMNILIYEMEARVHKHTGALTHIHTHKRDTHPVIVELPQGHVLSGGHSSTRPSLFKSCSHGNGGGYTAPRVCE